MEIIAGMDEQHLQKNILPQLIQLTLDCSLFVELYPDGENVNISIVRIKGDEEFEILSKFKTSLVMLSNYVIMFERIEQKMNGLPVEKGYSWPIG